MSNLIKSIYSDYKNFMANNSMDKTGFATRLSGGITKHAGLVGIIVAVMFIELTTAIMYYSARDIIQILTEKNVRRELNAIALCIQNKLIRVETTIDNVKWMTERQLQEPDSMFGITRKVVENNPHIFGCSISFVPDYYKSKGYWFQPFAAIRKDGTIESIQLGSERHDYTKRNFFNETMEKKAGNWCEPYLDSEGAKNFVTSYGAPVCDADSDIVAVLVADITLDWLEQILNESKIYQSTQRFLVSGKYMQLAGNDCFIYKKALEELKRDENKNGYSIMRDENGKKKHVLFTKVGGATDWILINVLDDSEIFKEISNVRMLLLILVIAGLIPVGFIVYRTSRNLQRFKEVNSEKDRVKGELRIASKLQQFMLPNIHVIHEDIEIFGSLVPAREVGGDLFDYFIRDEKMFFAIGDVSGKGAPSAMLMAVIHSLFRMAATRENNPAKIMKNINGIICSRNEANMFVTFFIGVLDIPTGFLRFCNAGHELPFMIEYDKKEERGKSSKIECVPNLPLGVFDIKYEMQEIILKKKTTIFLYTDGLTEAMDKDRKLFGIKRTEMLMEECGKKNMKPEQILAFVTNMVHQFVADAQQSDDLTMMAILFDPKPFNPILEENIILKNSVAEIPRFSDFIKNVTQKLNIEKTLMRKLRLAVEEAVVNVIEYAYPNGNEGEVNISVLADDKKVKFIIVDKGNHFDPTIKEMADTTLSAEERQIGGLGILLVRELMDTINYERKDGKNILTLVKNITI